MYRKLFLLSLLFAFAIHTQAAGAPISRDTVPSGVPQLFGGKYYKFNGYVLVDSFIMTAAGDTNNIPYFPALEFKSSDNRWYGYDRSRWQKFLWPGDTTSLSNRINLKLNISDTTSMLSSYVNFAGYGLIKSGQTLRADTSATGLATQFDLTQIAANLQEVMDNGNVTNRRYIYDSTATATDGNATTGYPFIINPLDRTGSPPPFTFALGATKFSGVTRRDNVMSFGWNLSGGGGAYQAGEVGIGESWEHTYIPSVGDTIDAEKHEFYITRTGTQKRLSSYTIRENIGNYDFYHTVSRLYLKNPSNEQQYFVVQPSSTGGSLSIIESASTQNANLVYDNTFGVTLTSTAGTNFRLQGFSAAQFPLLELSNTNEAIFTDGIDITSQTGNTTNLGTTTKRWLSVFANTLDGNIIQGNTRIKAGTSGAQHTAALMNVSNNANSTTTLSIENINGGTAAAMLLRLTEDEGNGHYAEAMRFGAGYSGNFGGTSIPKAGMLNISNNLSNQPWGVVVVNSGAFFSLPNITATNIGFRNDVNGFRIDQIQNLHAGNTVPFEVNGNSKFTGTIQMQDGNQASGRVLTSDANGVGTWQPPASTSTLYTGDGTLAGNRTISTGGFTTDWTGSNDNETSFSVVNTGTTSANAISGTASGTSSIGVSGTSTSYIGVLGTSTSNNGIQGQSTSGIGVVGTSSTGAALRGQINPSSTNTIDNVVTLLRTSSSGGLANDGGSAIQFELETATNGTSQIAGSLAYKWTDATNATRTSQFEVYAVNSATTSRKLALAGTGQLTLDGYTTNAFSGTPVNTLQTTSTGVVIQGPLVASGTWTATLTAVSNVDGTPTFTKAHYTRVGNEVTYSIEIIVDPTATGTVTEVRFSLPVASNLAAAGDILGALAGETTGTAAVSGHVETDTVNDEGIIQFKSQSVNNHTITVSGHYSIL